MYVFYGDEIGFSKGSGLEPEQPITLFAGILVNITKLHKSTVTFDRIIGQINMDMPHAIRS